MVIWNQLTHSLSLFRNLCGHCESHGSITELGARADPDGIGPSGQPGDAGAAESPATAAHDDRAATPPSATTTTSTTESCPAAADNCPGAEQQPDPAAASAASGAASTAPAADPQHAQAQVALLSALQQRIRHEERAAAAHAETPRGPVHGASACVRVRKGVLPEEPPHAAPEAAHREQAAGGWWC